MANWETIILGLVFDVNDPFNAYSAEEQARYTDLAILTESILARTDELADGRINPGVAIALFSALDAGFDPRTVPDVLEVEVPKVNRVSRSFTRIFQSDEAKAHYSDQRYLDECQLKLEQSIIQILSETE